MQFYKINENGYPVVGSGKSIPEGFAEFTYDVELDVYSPKELDDAIKLQTAKEDLEKQVSEAKQYLLDTDWIIVKINEAQLLGQDIQPLLAKYSVELGEREAKRTIINSLEG